MSASALLLDTARRGELHHSVILAGPVPDQIRSLALSIAKSLNCFNRTSGDDCISCQKIERGTHPDVHLVSVEEDRKLISVEQVRRVVNDATLRPYEGRFKVFLIEPAEALSVSGENALLKTLEEPTRDTVFLLLTRNPDLLLPTIRSRSQAIWIHPQTDLDDELRVSIQAARLRHLSLWPAAGEKEAIENIAREVLAALESCARGNRAALLLIAAQLSSRDDVSSALSLLVALFRDLSGLEPEHSIDPEGFRAIQSAFNRAQFLESASLALRAMTRLEVNADVRLMIEQALGPLASIQHSASSIQ